MQPERLHILHVVVAKPDLEDRVHHATAQPDREVVLHDVGAEPDRQDIHRLVAEPHHKPFHALAAEPDRHHILHQMVAEPDRHHIHCHMVAEPDRHDIPKNRHPRPALPAVVVLLHPIAHQVGPSRDPWQLRQVRQERSSHISLEKTFMASGAAF